MNRLRIIVILLFCYVLLQSVATADGAEIDGINSALSPTVVTGTLININAPPSTARDTDTTTNSVAYFQSLMEQYKTDPDFNSVYQSIHGNWQTTQHPSFTLAEIGSFVKQQYQDLMISRMATPAVTQVSVEPITLVYPSGYSNNAAPVTVHVKRLTLAATDRTLVAYYANYDKLAEHDDSLIFQVNGHFGTNPSRLGFGLEQNGGLSGAALGLIAMQGLPLLTYDDHNVGESSSANDSLIRTLENMQMIDQVLLSQFDHVDALGISGGAERLYYFMPLFKSNLRSVYYSGFAVPQWTRLVGPPFGSDPDTFDQTLLDNFQFADLALVGLARGVETAFAHNTFEGGKSKYGYFEEILPTLKQYTDDFQTRGDDQNGDGIPDYGTGLSHEYNLPDYFAFLQQIRVVPEPSSCCLTWQVIAVMTAGLRRRRLRSAERPTE